MDRLKKKSPRHGAAIRAGAPAAIVPIVPPVNAHAGAFNVTTTAIVAPIVPPAIAPAVSPLQSPLAELSPRFANNNDPEADRPLSPTYGQLQFIQDQMQFPWKYATVPFQSEPASKSIFMFVRPDANKTIEEVSSKLSNNGDLLTTTLATCCEVSRDLPIRDKTGDERT